MELFVNDLSLHAQFPAPAAFRDALGELLRCRNCATTFDRMCYVPRSISKRMVGPDMSFREAVNAFGNRDFTRQVVTWIDRQGPFADDALTRNPDEYYVFGDDEEVITEEMLGEAAARQFDDRPTALVSFAPSNFTQSPLTVTWHRSDNQCEACDIQNFWETTALHQELEKRESEVQTWVEMLERARARYTNLTFFDNLEEHLEGQPFSSTIARRALELLAILNQLKGSYTATGERTEEGEHLMDKHFRRKNAIFTDAAENEKNNPSRRAAMTFRLPGGEPMECFWHGKISHRYFRIHFNKLTANQPLHIAYIGPHT